jgi:hypothetical protein
MTEEKDLEIHKIFAIQTFNQTWDLIDKPERSQAEIDRMINTAHASRYHWEIAGEPVNIARGEWQISRVYAILLRLEPCLYHASRCLQITLENDLKDFDLAFAYEAMARACNLAGDDLETSKYMVLAEEAGAQIEKKDNRDYFFSELRSILPGS